MDELFSILETIIDIKDTKLNTLRVALDNLQDTQLKLNETVDICNKVKDIEIKYKQVRCCMIVSVRSKLLCWKNFRIAH